MSSAYLDPRTGQTFPLDQPRWCGPDHAPLLLTPLPGLTRAQIDTATRSLWRYRAALPMQVDDPITMGEGCTPLIRRTLHGAPALLKCEWFMPTGSFKDRGASVMLSLLRAQGVREVLEDSSGNGGAAVSAYAAAGGMQCHDHGARLHQPGEDGADARAWRHRGADPRHAAGHRRCRGAPLRDGVLRQSQLAPVLPARHQDAGLRAVGGSGLPRTRQHRHAVRRRVQRARLRDRFFRVAARRRDRRHAAHLRRPAGELRADRRGVPCRQRCCRSPPRSARRSPKAPRSRSRSGSPRCSARCAKRAAAR